MTMPPGPIVSELVPMMPGVVPLSSVPAGMLIPRKETPAVFSFSAESDSLSNWRVSVPLPSGTVPPAQFEATLYLSLGNPPPQVTVWAPAVPARIEARMNSGRRSRNIPFSDTNDLQWQVSSEFTPQGHCRQDLPSPPALS